MHWPEEVCALVLKTCRVTDYNKTVPPASAGTQSIRFFTSDMYSPTHGPNMGELKAPAGQRRTFPNFLPKVRKLIQIGKAGSSNVEPVIRHKGRQTKSLLFIDFNPSSRPKSRSNKFPVPPDRQILTTMPAILLTTLKENENQTTKKTLNLLLFENFF